MDHASASNPTAPAGPRVAGTRFLPAVISSLVALGLLSVAAGFAGRVSVADAEARSLPQSGVGDIIGFAFGVAVAIGAALAITAVVVGRSERRPVRRPATLGQRVVALILVTAILILLVRLAPDLLDRLRLLTERLADSGDTADDGAGGGPALDLGSIDARWLPILAVIGGIALLVISRVRRTPTSSGAESAAAPAVASAERRVADDRHVETIEIDLDRVAQDPNARMAVIAADVWLEQQLAAGPTGRRPSETTAEHLGRLGETGTDHPIDKHSTDSAPDERRRFSGDLDRALFSDGPLDATSRDRAVRTVRRLADEP